MKKIILLLLTLISFKSNALDCMGFDEKEIYEADYIFKGKLNKKELVVVEGVEYTKNSFYISEILKGQPDSLSVRTMKFEDKRLPDGRYDWSVIDYSGYNQVYPDIEYIILGKHNEDLYSGPCGGYFYEADFIKPYLEVSKIEKTIKSIYYFF
tara:strand:- start:14684 stop:15142 length:459 start_codon:yes stop_codon:yes gene_type:complete